MPRFLFFLTLVEGGPEEPKNVDQLKENKYLE